MEVEVMKANSRQAGRADWPMNCICNLCSCGSHSCASFPLNDSNYSSSNNNNRCRRNLGLSNLKMNSRRGVRRSSETEEAAISGSQGDGCAGRLFELGERYLATGGGGGGGKRSPANREPTGKLPEDHGEQERRAADELLHVLVTRPEIASKPRDNIIFEGDMDLRTTFETSYEALAKMRLDQWKRYQEVATKSCGAKTASPDREANKPTSRRHTASRRQMSRGSPIELDSDSKEPAEVGVNGNEDQDQQQDKEREGVSRPRTLENTIESHATSRHAIRGAKGAETAPRSRTPFAIADTNSQNIHDSIELDYHYNLNQSSRPHVGGSSPLRQKQRHQIANEVTVQKHTKQLAAETPAPVDELAQRGAADNVDPDLAPIIVYDSNMNRLERVGIRKRSKYRPSTSLRSGARGLFGDQVPDSEQETNHGGLTSRNEDKAMQTDNGTLTGGHDPQMVTETDAAAHSRASIIMGARNLKDSSQTPDRLVFSERNVPVNSKRRVEGNVNMRDHVREQNIVDGGRYQPPAPRPDNVQAAAAAEQANTNGVLEPSDELAGAEFGALERDLADIRLAEQEEAAANAEIQRVAALDPAALGSLSLMHHQQQSSFSSKAVGCGGGGGGGSETRTSSRQSRSQRTCQEQSFHIGQNDYPAESAGKFSPPSEAKFKSTSAMNSSHASPQSRVYNNLFSESPDFILTTGGPHSEDKGRRSLRVGKDKKQPLLLSYSALDEQHGHGDRSFDSKNDTVTDDSRALLPLADTEATDTANQAHHYQQHHEALSDCHAGGGGCKVTRLDERFQYVGSRSGHKYFVEKILDPE